MYYTYFFNFRSFRYFRIYHTTKPQTFFILIFLVCCHFQTLVTGTFQNRLFILIWIFKVYFFWKFFFKLDLSVFLLTLDLQIYSNKWRKKYSKILRIFLYYAYFFNFWSFRSFRSFRIYQQTFDLKFVSLLSRNWDIY